AGWDGCLGIIDPAATCLQMYLVGVIANFEAVGQAYRYHVGDDRFVATDFVDQYVTFTDGGPVEHDLAPDNDEILREYARQDLALRLDIDPAAVAVDAFENVTWPDSCVGVYYKDALCGQAL